MAEFGVNPNSGRAQYPLGENSLIVNTRNAFLTIQKNLAMGKHNEQKQRKIFNEWEEEQTAERLKKRELVKKEKGNVKEAQKILEANLEKKNVNNRNIKIMASKFHATGEEEKLAIAERNKIEAKLSEIRKRKKQDEDALNRCRGAEVRLDEEIRSQRKKLNNKKRTYQTLAAELKQFDTEFEEEKAIRLKALKDAENVARAVQSLYSEATTTPAEEVTQQNPTSSQEAAYVLASFYEDRSEEPEKSNSVKEFDTEDTNEHGFENDEENCRTNAIESECEGVHDDGWGHEEHLVSDERSEMRDNVDWNNDDQISTNSYYRVCQSGVDTLESIAEELSIDILPLKRVFVKVYGDLPKDKLAIDENIPLPIVVDDNPAWNADSPKFRKYHEFPREGTTEATHFALIKTIFVILPGDPNKVRQMARLFMPFLSNSKYGSSVFDAVVVLVKSGKILRNLTLDQSKKVLKDVATGRIIDFQTRAPRTPKTKRPAPEDYVRRSGRKRQLCRWNEYDMRIDRWLPASEHPLHYAMYANLSLDDKPDDTSTARFRSTSP